MTGQTFRVNAKLLLTGEYSVIKGGVALAIPLNSHFGVLKIDQKNVSIYETIRNFGAHLKKIRSILEEYLDFDFERFESELSSGIAIESNIPIGYGLGSSGVFCVCVLLHYGTFRKPIAEIPLGSLKHLLGRMEDYFHNPSSGLDPLVSLVNRPILLNQSEGSCAVLNQKITHYFELIDTGISRSTSRYVAIFLEKYNSSPLFRKNFEQLLEINQAVTESILTNTPKETTALMQRLSKWQFDHIIEMIPLHFVNKWKESLDQGSKYYKINGAGGGGYLMQWNYSN